MSRSRQPGGTDRGFGLLSRRASCSSRPSISPFTDTFLLPPAQYHAPRFDVIGYIGYVGNVDGHTRTSQGLAAMLMQQGPLTSPAAIEDALERFAVDLGDKGTRQPVRLRSLLTRATRCSVSGWPSEGRPLIVSLVVVPRFPQRPRVVAAASGAAGSNTPADVPGDRPSSVPRRRHRAVHCEQDLRRGVWRRRLTTRGAVAPGRSVAWTRLRRGRGLATADRRMENWWANARSSAAGMAYPLGIPLRSSDQVSRLRRRLPLQRVAQFDSLCGRRDRQLSLHRGVGFCRPSEKCRYDASGLHIRRRGGVSLNRWVGVAGDGAIPTCRESSAAAGVSQQFAEDTTNAQRQGEGSGRLGRSRQARRWPLDTDSL